MLIIRLWAEAWYNSEARCIRRIAHAWCGTRRIETAKQRLSERDVCESMVVRENGFRVKVSRDFGWDERNLFSAQFIKLASKAIEWGPPCYVFRPCVNVPNLLSNFVIIKTHGTNTDSHHAMGFSFCFAVHSSHEPL